MTRDTGSVRRRGEYVARSRLVHRPVQPDVRGKERWGRRLEKADDSKH